MEIKDLNAKVDKLADLRRQKNVVLDVVAKMRADFEQTLSPKMTEIMVLQDSIRELQDEILTVLRESNTKNWKTNNATVSRKSTLIYNIVDKDKVITKLKELKLDGEYTRVEIIPQIKVLFDAQGNFDGVEKVEKEFISVIVRQEEKKNG